MPSPAARDEDKAARRAAPPATLAGAVLDTLLCIMVDSSPALRAFEEASGVRAVVRILKRAGTPRETRYAPPPPRPRLPPLIPCIATG